MDIPLDSTVARTDHQTAVAELLAAARAIDAAQWERKPDALHWSPAQIAEHVRLVYDVVGEQFDGGPGLRVRTPWWLRVVLRWKFLKNLLETGKFPRGARAPREISPGDGPFPRDTVLAALEQSANAMEAKLMRRWEDPNCLVTHHVFGALRPPQGARLVTVHTAHHARQLRLLSR
jgi:hypothetical protein